MTHYCINLNVYHTDYLDEIAHLPMYTSSGLRVIGLHPGKRFPRGCVHESLREAEKCCHDSYSWDNADEVLIIKEGLT